MLLTHKNSMVKPFSFEETKDLTRKLSDTCSLKNKLEATLELSKNAKRILYTLLDAFNDLTRLDRENRILDKTASSAGNKVKTYRTMLKKLIAERKSSLSV